MSPSLFGELETNSDLRTFAPDKLQDEMTYVSLACRCGHERFHLSGWPTIASGTGGFFWRSLTRVFREARLPMEEGELVESPFWLPMFVRCDQCSRESTLLDDPRVAGSLPIERRGEPVESFRCRVCRRGSLELVVGTSVDAARPDRLDLEIIARCATCHREHRVAWSKGRPSEQEVRLDLLYGRR